MCLRKCAIATLILSRGTYWKTKFHFEVAVKQRPICEDMRADCRKREPFSQSPQLRVSISTVTTTFNRQITQIVYSTQLN